MPHQRRKSGNTSTTELRKSVTVTDMSKHKRPALSRKQTPVSAQKLGRTQREREREWHEVLDDERDSFPQYCMTCEKQFIPYDEKHVYCSDSCRRVDQSSLAKANMPRSYLSEHYPLFSAGETESSRDIIPQASPSRPGSMHFANSPPHTPNTTASYHSSAMSSLRSLTKRPPSPPSPVIGHGASFWPFNSTRSAATSPSTSYTRPSAAYLSSTYDSGYSGGYYTYDVSSGRMDRPLPPSRHPSHSRPQSIELVTPMVNGR